jgi:DNA/RNA-binding domain of Phe-tRNA-synthetase-like protein
MTALRVSEEIFRAFPDVLIGVVVFEGVRNSGESSEIVAALRREEERTASAFAGTSISDHPLIAPWRAAYRAFGAKPKNHPSSIENLVRRAVKAQSLPHVNPIVDLYNTVSLRRLIPIGGEDLDKVAGDVELAFATAHEPPVRLLGEPEARPPKPGEVIYRDRVGALCRRWNWKEADRTKLTETTRDGFLVAEALPPLGRAEIDEVLAELVSLVQTHCGGRARASVLDRGHPSVALDAP